MAAIQVLASHVADLIAAGEVVERPASVVKELTENAIDAGAHMVTIEIQRGGMSMIRVTDDGSGIPADQCETAFLRHATSKLRTPEDLAAIGTLGFRGEALAAIASVSRMELFTRTAEEDLGTTLTLEGGQVVAKDQAGCPLGTTMVVRDLFFNTPARLKFMKRDATEGAAVFALVQKLALSHPEVAVKFIRDGKQDLMTPGDGKLSSALYAVLGRDMALGFLPVEAEGEDMTVSGFVSMPVCCRGSRNTQYFFVNGRQVKSALLTTALERAYENQKMLGRFPGCVLQIQVKPNTVDVNVHPAKTEVKFLYERKVFSGVYYGVLSALQAQQGHPKVVFPQEKPAEKREAPAPAVPPSPAPSKPAGAAPSLSAPVQPLRAPTAVPRTTPSASAWDLLRPVEKEYTPKYTRLSPRSNEFSPQFPKKSTDFPENVEKPVESVEKTLESVGVPKGTPVDTPPAPPVPPKPAEGSVENPAEPAPLLPETKEIPWRLAGEVLDTYLIVEQGDTIYFIDKHAAHERMHFDRMKEEGYTPMAQTLLAPVIFTPSPEEGTALLAQEDLLRRFGFACEDFGGGALAVREIPDYLEPGQVEEALCAIAGDLLTGGGADPAAARDAVLHTMACKAAIKGGQKSTPQEKMVVARAVLSGEVKYCPHGRPVAITMTRGQLERQFKRS
ncbi:MAG: DNA mismatch repair endonuclease MutL [Evtepia sp.]|uniref:DNA mismatch repair endonuclease MutL n=1 Tax=Evtepia sp. TaxID=2773933 RepID=UPI002A764762|nr:DNA mismatch repair endonuclease MutL [Evtepia sp.]MDY3015403.1 DNA mismatch repair endonuclease MutL [Evtepia sp.]